MPAQTFKHSELIVAGGCSTDDTRRVLERHQSQLTYIHPEHRECSAARNRGILASKGEYAAVLDTDDFWRPTYPEKQVAALRGDVEAGLSHTWTLVTDRDGRDVHQLRGGASERPDHVTLLNALLAANRFPFCSVMVGKACLGLVGGFDRRLGHAEDWDLWLRIALRYRVLSVAEPLTCQRCYNRLIRARMVPAGLGVLPSRLTLVGCPL